MAEPYTVYRRRIEEHRVPGRKLGRHVHHDSRSLAYLWPATGSQADVIHQRRIPVLDQGDVGSCTGNAETGAIGTDPLYPALPAGHPALGEPEALRLYSAAEVIDGNGKYPPNDDGSSGLSVAKAAKAAGLISGYQHATSVQAMISALQQYPVIIGISWYDSFDDPDSEGLIRIAKGAQVRGGHEVEVIGWSSTSNLFTAVNSWGTGWGVNGTFLFSADTMTRLFSEEGDCTVSLPLTVPAPTPTPVPVPPAPVPPGPDTDPADVALADAQTAWAWYRHVGENRKAALASQAWLQEKGFVTPPSGG